MKCTSPQLLPSLHVTDKKTVEPVKRSSQYKIATVTFNFITKTPTVMNKIKTNFEGQTIFVGMDIHKSSWNLGIHLNDMFIAYIIFFSRNY